MLKLTNLVAGYGALTVLHQIDLEVNAGEIVTLIGANGAGKSTLLKTISGLIRPTQGEVCFENQSLLSIEAHQIVQLGVSHVPEGRRIFEQFSVAENIEIGAFLRKDKEGVAKDKETCYLLFPILKERAKQKAGTLSGGEQQMLALCRALMSRPKLLLLDEPSLGLAPLVIKQIFEIIRKINREQQVTVFLVEQNARLALTTADRAYVIENGQITLSGVAQDLLGNPNIQKAYLGIAD